MKKAIKFETLYEFQKGNKPQILANPPSKSFLTQARIALTEQLAEWIEDSFCKAHFVECLDILIDWSGVSRSAGEKPLLPLLVEPKSDAYILLECSLSWAYRQPGRTEIPYPWLDYAGGDLRFRLIADPLDVRKMNAEIPELVTPVIRTNESGLPYDYRIKTHDGTMQIVFRGPVTDADLNAVGAISDRFFAEYNETHENKIHDIETPRKHREKSVCFGVDFGGATAAAVVDLIGSFRSVEGIRKIIFQ